jgi:hypothetical protein
MGVRLVLDNLGDDTRGLRGLLLAERMPGVGDFAVDGLRR